MKGIKRLKSLSTTRLLIIAAALAVVVSVASIGAYYTDMDSESNVFEHGSVDISLSETNWNETNGTNLRPGQSVSKNPVVKNEGENNAFVFLKVIIPKEEIYTYNPSTLARNEKAVTELFQLNQGTKAYTGEHTYSSDWVIATVYSGEDTNEYIFAYGTGAIMKELKPGESTSALFDSISYCYAVEGQDLDSGEKSIQVEAYAIQANDIKVNNSAKAIEVWNVLTETNNNNE